MRRKPNTRACTRPSALLTTLAGIGETVLLYHDGGKGRPRAKRMLTDRDPIQQQLADLFGIDRYAPTR